MHEDYPPLDDGGSRCMMDLHSSPLVLDAKNFHRAAGVTGREAAKYVQIEDFDKMFGLH